MHGTAPIPPAFAAARAAQLVLERQMADFPFQPRPRPPTPRGVESRIAGRRDRILRGRQGGRGGDRIELTRIRRRRGRPFVRRPIFLSLLVRAFGDAQQRPPPPRDGDPLLRAPPAGPRGRGRLPRRGRRPPPAVRPRRRLFEVGEPRPRVVPSDPPPLPVAPRAQVGPLDRPVGRVGRAPFVVRARVAVARPRPVHVRDVGRGRHQAVDPPPRPPRERGAVEARPPELRLGGAERRGDAARVEIGVGVGVVVNGASVGAPRGHDFRRSCSALAPARSRREEF